MPALPPDAAILNRLREIVAGTLELEVAAIDAGTCARNTPEWDSLSHMRILAAVERGFGVTLPRLAAFRVQDVGELAGLVAAEAGRR